MSSDLILVFLVLLLIGLVEVSFGAWTLLGNFKRWYIGKGIPGFFPKDFVYNSIPIGIAFLLLACIALTSNYKLQDVLWLGFALMLGVAFIVSVWKPDFLKPKWLRWLKQNYSYVLEEMFEEARQMGGRNWEAQVKTQADLERWADSVAQKNGWQRQHNGKR